MATEMLQQLLAGQIEGIARQIAAKTGQDVDACVEIAHKHIKDMDLTEVAKRAGKKGRKATTRKAPKVISPECRCKARVWGTGSGNDQCRLAALDGKDFCKRHQKKADETVETSDGKTLGGETPCIIYPWSEDNNCKDVKGKKTGLFFGRIDEDTPIVDEQGVIRIEWNNPEIQELMSDKVENGEWRYSKGRGNRRSEGTKKKKAGKKPAVVDQKALEEMLSVDESDSSTPNADEKVNPLTAFKGEEEEEDSNPKPKVQIVTTPKVTETSRNGSIVVQNGDEAVRFSTDGTSVPVLPKPNLGRTDSTDSTETVIEEEDDLLNDLNAGSDDDEDDEDEVVVEEIDYNGQTYLVEANSGTIYDPETEEPIGTWDFDESKPKLD